MSKLLQFDRDHLWHPYTSALAPLRAYEVTSADGVRLRLADGRELIDGMSSWWCAIHGYNDPLINAALKGQMERMAHVMFGGITHEPAVKLAERLLEIVPPPLRHLFFCDSGSVSVEVAIKMALQFWQAVGRPRKTRLLTVRGGYHGDTFAAMSVCDPVTGMHHLFKDMLPKQFFAERPACRFDASFDSACLDDFRRLIVEHEGEIAAVILEPVVQGAGGMWFYHPDYLHGVRELCDQHGVLLVLDEIATGFGRTGKLFACEWAGISPDILCLGKALTGGYLTLAVTLATSKVAEGISSAGGVFMHGPTFMANPLACAVAGASIDLLLARDWQAAVGRIEAQLRKGLEPARLSASVADVRVLGAIGVIEMKEAVDVESLQAFFVERGVWIRPFGRLIYIMPPYMIDENDLGRLCEAMVAAVERGCV